MYAWNLETSSVSISPTLSRKQCQNSAVCPRPSDQTKVLIRLPTLSSFDTCTSHIQRARCPQGGALQTAGIMSSMSHYLTGYTLAIV